MRPQKNWNLSRPKIGAFARIGVVINGGAGVIALQKAKIKLTPPNLTPVRATVLKPCRKWHICILHPHGPEVNVRLCQVS